MSEKNIPWKRYWIEFGNQPSLDDQGFLLNTFFWQYQEKELITNEQLSEIPCLLLLGEPGIGKSNEIENLALVNKDNRNLTLSINLREFESIQDFKSTLSENVTIQNWREDQNDQLTIYFDSLDEALIEAKQFTRGLIEIIRKENQAGSLKIRIACRSADLPSKLLPGLESTFEDGQVKAVELVPLSRDDIKQAANKHKLDSEYFLSSIVDKDLGVLASRPITLNLLLQEFSTRGNLPDDILKIYHEGILHLLAESEERIEYDHAGELSERARLLIAERIAVVIILANKSAIYSGSLRKKPQIDIDINNVEGGFEKWNHRDSLTEVAVSQSNIKETLNTALFKTVGSNRSSFVHQTFTEFLAAKYLLRRDFKISEIKKLLLFDDGTSIGVIPQLKQVAVWLAALSDDFFDLLLKIDPELLLRSNIILKAEKRKEALSNEILIRAGESRLTRGDNFKYYKQAQYRGVSDDLRSIISDRKQALKKRYTALSIARALQLKTLGNDFASLVLDKNDNTDLRSYTLDILFEWDNEQANLELKPFLETDNYESVLLKAKAIKNLYPKHITIETLLSVISSSEDLKRESLRTAGNQILEKSDSDQLAKILDWAVKNEPNEDIFRPQGYFWDEIILKSLDYIENEDILNNLSVLIYHRIKDYRDIFRSTSAEKRYDKLLENENARKEIVKKIVAIYTKEEDLAYKIRRFQQQLVLQEDFDWVLKQVKKSTDSNEAQVWAKILDWIFDINNTSHIEKILREKENKAIDKVFRHRLEPIALNSKQAKKAREIHQEAMQYKSEHQNFVLDPSPEERVQKQIDELEKGNPDAYWRLNLELSLQPNSRNYDEILNFDLTQYPGWKRAGKRTRKKIIKFAKECLKESNPAQNDWLNDPKSRSGFRAFNLINFVEPEYLESLSNKVWQKWLKSIVYFEVSDGFKVTPHLVKILHKKHPEEVNDFLIDLVKEENEKHEGTILLIRNIDSIWNKELADKLFKLSIGDDLETSAIETIRDYLLLHRHQDTISHIRSSLIDTNNQNFVSNAYLLSKYYHANFFELVWPEIEDDFELGNSIMRRIAQRERHEFEFLGSLTEEQLVKLYIWLENNYPAREDLGKPYVARRITSRDELADLRRHSFNQLISFGTAEACHQVESLISKFPKKKWLNTKLEEARENYRKNNWNPISPEELISLAENNDKTIISNEWDLFETVLRTLDKLQKKLRNQEQPQAVYLWNTDPEYKPFDENAITDYIIVYLREELEEKGIILNREVEVNRGSETDIHVVAIAPDGNKYQTTRLIIEVKGCWNKDLWTAFEDQLINRYMKKSDCKAGIYLIGWFLCEKWCKEDWKYNKTPKKDLSQIKKEFDNMRDKLLKKHQGMFLGSYILDLQI